MLKNVPRGTVWLLQGAIFFKQPLAKPAQIENHPAGWFFG
jgi:hypothetical protein